MPFHELGEDNTLVGEFPVPSAESPASETCQTHSSTHVDSTSDRDVHTAVPTRMRRNVETPSNMSGVSEAPLLAVRDLRTYFFTRTGIGKAVDGVSFELRRGETLGLVGESGCGKSITALSILQLLPRAARLVGGEIKFQGEDLVGKTASELRGYRGRHIALILQDPMAALDPLFTVGDQVEEPLRIHQRLEGPSLRMKVYELLRLLRVDPPELRFRNFPHQLSGGTKQRVVGAIAISGSPEVLIADEPTTSLDATVQAAFLVMLKEIQEQTGLAILFITHDFGIVAKMCDRVAVMYAGRIVETAPTTELFARPTHPYTEALLNAVPDVTSEPRRLASIPGSPPSIYEGAAGCAFAPRCPYVEPKYREVPPPETQIGPDHTVRCWKYA